MKWDFRAFREIRGRSVLREIEAPSDRRVIPGLWGLPGQRVTAVKKGSAALILTYQNTSTSSVRISVAPKDTAAPVLTDMRRITIYNNTSIESQTYNNTIVSTRTVLDDLMYSQSQESHSIKIRQQDPVTKLWSLCEIRSFISNGGARTSVWVQWSEVNVSYEAPTA